MRSSSTFRHDSVLLYFAQLLHPIQGFSRHLYVLYGPPGSGKTFLVAKVSKTWQITLYCLCRWWRACGAGWERRTP